MALWEQRLRMSVSVGGGCQLRAIAPRDRMISGRENPGIHKQPREEDAAKAGRGQNEVAPR